MTTLPSVDLARIRSHGGAKDRAFEELAYLLAWDLEGLDRGTEIERRSTPDGGVEFSCIPTAVGSSGRWAWQAKYLFRFDNSTFQQMTKSVIAALDSTPDLEKYVFVFPKDRSSVGLTKWNSFVKRWSKEASKRQMSVTFEFRGESQLLAALTSDRHAGAIRYFFDELFLTHEFFVDQVDREIDNLGDRYDPRVNVETGAREIIDAACRGPRFVEELTSLMAAIGRKGFHYDSAATDPIVVAGRTVVGELVDRWKEVAAALLDQLAVPGEAVFSRLSEGAKDLVGGLQAELKAVQSRVDDLNRQSERARSRRSRTSATGSPRKRRTKAQLAEDEREACRRSLDSFESFLYQLTGTVEELVGYLRSDDVRAAIGGSVLLVGEAGCGKSHLVADLAKERVASDLPSVLVLGQTFVEGAVDPQLVSVLGLGAVPLTDVLQALDVAARIRRNGRALLIIDALNEGAGADVWANQLRGFVTRVAKYEWVALVVTVRDVYEGAVVPLGLDGVVRAVHHGLEGHEEEALTLYAALYGLRLPDIPALLPELSNPLFLRSLCLSVQGRGITEIPREAASLVWVFDGLIGAVDAVLRGSTRLDYPDWEEKVERAVHELAAAMVDAGTESLTLAEANAICLKIHAESRYSHSLLNGLIVEGLLLRERVERDGSQTEAVRFTYQRLSDHLRADVLLARNPNDDELAAVVREIAGSPHRWALSGVIEALVLLVPERRGRELAEVLGLATKITRDRYTRRDSPAAWLQFRVQSGFMETLAWRSPSTFTPAAKELLDRYLKSGFVSSHDWLRIVSSLACVPDHPLNAEWLHPILARMSLPERDKAWSLDLLWIYSDDVNPIDRTINWAWSNPNAAPDVARLSSLFLSWLLTSPDRRLRDTATKALVSVTTNHTRLLTDLVNEFIDVDDPYVLDRLIAAAYGHVLRRRTRALESDDIEALSQLGGSVFDAVFGKTPRTHLMVRHQARSCIRLVEQLCREAGTRIDRDVQRIDPPYSSSWPLRARTGRQLAKGFGRQFDGYLGSATELDWEFEQDMERRIVSDFVLPDQAKARSARLRALHRQKTLALKNLIDAAPPSQKKRVRRRAEKLLELSRSGEAASSTSRQWTSFEESLSRSAREHAAELHSVTRALANLDDEVFHPDADLCTRWVADRMLDLGWTKERFGDRSGRGSRNGHEQVRESIAKKYQRIGFQELCGHLADHCQIQEYWRDEPELYRGPWQVSEALDADPSLLVRGDEPESDTPAARLRAIRLRDESAPAWWRTFEGHSLNALGADEDWLSDLSDIPRPEQLLSAVDPSGHEWVALERHQEWSIEDSVLESDYSRDRRILWFRSQAYMSRADQSELSTWAANENWMGLRALSTPQDVWLAHLGEYPDIEPWPSLLDQGDKERRPYPPNEDPGATILPDGWEFARAGDSVGVPCALATTWRHQESSNDFSATDTPSVIMPSRTLLALLGARWAGGRVSNVELQLGPVEREYAWVDGSGVVAFCSSGRRYGSTRILWVKAKSLSDALTDAGLIVWSWTLGEKIYWSNNDPSSNRTDCFSAVAMSPGAPNVWGYTIERDHYRGNRARRSRLYMERDGVLKSCNT